MGIPVIDLFASRLSNEIAKYFAWQPDPHSLATDTIQHEWDQEILYAFPPVFVDSESTLQSSKGES